MPVKRIQLRGISRTPSDRMIADGGVAESLNMFVDNTESAPALRPMDITKQEGLPENSEYDILYIHKGNGYTNYIRTGTVDEKIKYIQYHVKLIIGVSLKNYYDSDFAYQWAGVVEDLGKVKLTPEEIQGLDEDFEHLDHFDFLTLPGTFETLDKCEHAVERYLNYLNFYLNDKMEYVFDYPSCNIEEEEIYDGSRNRKAIGAATSSGFKAFLALQDDEEYASTTSVGNSLIVSTSLHNWYILYKGGEYVNLGNTIPLPKIKIEMVEQSQAGIVDIWGKDDPFVAQIEQTADESSCSRWNRFYENGITIEADRLFDAIYDGISVADAKITAEGIYSYPVYVNFGVKLYDDSVHCIQPILLGGGIESPFKILVAEVFMSNHLPALLHECLNISRTNAYKIAFKIESIPDNWDLWKDLITEVNFYVSTPVGYDLPGIRSASAKVFDSFDLGNMPGIMRDVILGSKKYGFKESLESNSRMYLLQSYTNEDFSKLPIRTQTIINSANKILPSQMASDEALLKDYFITEPEYRYLGALSMNNRILAYGVKEKIVCDSYLLPNVSTPLPSRYTWETLYVLNVTYDGAKSYKKYNFPCCPSRPSKRYNVSFRFIVVKDNHRVVVLNERVSENDLLKYGANTFAFITCPYPQATHVQVCVQTEKTESSPRETFYKTFPMQPLGFSNMSYYFGGLDKSLLEVCEGSYEEPLELTDQWINRTNLAILSNVDSPFYFPLSGFYSFNSGVIGIGTVTTPLSEGQSGQFAVYAFTQNGIYAMEMDGEGKFAAINPNLVSRDIALPGTIMSLEQGVVFATDKGFMILSGSKVTNLSPDMNGRHYRLDDCVAKLLSDDADYDDLVPIMQDETPFMDFIRDSQCMYDYAGNRLILVSFNNPEYQYIYKLDTATWHKISSDYCRIVRVLNSYPKAYAQVEANEKTVLYDYSPEISDEKTVAGRGVIITRPFDLDETDVRKSINQLLLRGNYNCGDVKVILLGSMDGHTYTRIPVRHAGSWKWFRAILLIDMTKYERLSYMDVEYETRFTNKLR